MIRLLRSTSGNPSPPRAAFAVFAMAAAVMLSAGFAAASDTPDPTAVTVAGSLQAELGCPDDWQPGCAATHLTFDAADAVWQGTFNVPAGSWEYKAPLNDAWDENYGLHAERNGPNIPLDLSAATSATAVKFFYSHETHWITDNHNSVIAVAPGSFQSELGCPGDWQPDCLRSWLQDPDGDGIYTLSTTAIPVGSYETKVAIDESWSENYGAGGARDGANIAFEVTKAGAEVFFAYDAVTHVLTVSATGAPKGSLTRAQAYWVTADTIAWKPAGAAGAADGSVALHHAADGGLVLDGTGISGGTSIPLTLDPAGLDAATLEKFPHLAGFTAYTVPSDSAEIAGVLKGQFAVEAKDADGELLDATSLQIQGVLDDLYTYDGPLGVTFSSGVPTVRVWAPTAKSVTLLVGNSGRAMTLDPSTGVWSLTGEASWTGGAYLFDVEVFVRSTGKVETNRVTDPYSVALTKNSSASLLVDLSDPALKPDLWDRIVKPKLEAPEDIVLYELHLRDFSASDPSVPESYRGTYKAFTLLGTNGMRHLSTLSAAGLTHIHLLPVFDIATIDEDRATWLAPEGDLSSAPPDSEEQQAAVTAVADRDGFNWGYDPWHYTVPEGSYSTNASDGTTRILEFREMVQSLNSIGLRVVMDVVYNHTNASGQNDRSVLDRIVPGYYHRLNADGNVETSTCCQNTASEFNMMEKLLIDSVVTWATQYKVDGFRFDLMGHHMKRNMLALRARLDALTIADDGVDGKAIYLYGEGWNFGEVANGARGVQATQLNMPGTGIGTFSDRLRDGARGGGPFSGIQEQGFLTGLADDPNGTDQGSAEARQARLLLQTDWIRVGLAGNLASYELIDRNGDPVTGADIEYNGQPAGYTSDPQEVITYVEAHDNETLFDAIQLKAAPAADMAQRVRMQNLGMSLVGFGQGIPFFHAGVELLRSKSLDRNSYNSGDWFNQLDFTYQDNNWGKGLPPAADNQGNWPLMAPLLADPGLQPSPGDIQNALFHFQEVLRIRGSSVLFRLRTGDDIKERVRFHSTGTEQIPGVITMTVNDVDINTSLDHQVRRLALFFNANSTPRDVQLTVFPCGGFKLHPLQALSHDAVVRSAAFDEKTCTFTIPGRTAAVFWQRRPADEQAYLLKEVVSGLVADGTLRPGQGRSLSAKLESARRNAQAGRTEAATAQLNAFIHEVEALRNAGVLSPEQAEPLITDARAAIEEMA